MLPITRIAAFAYVFVVFAGGYLAVATLKGIWSAAENFESLAVAAAAAEGHANRTLLVFDSIEPAAGEVQ